MHPVFIVSYYFEVKVVSKAVKYIYGLFYKKKNLIYKHYHVTILTFYNFFTRHDTHFFSLKTSFRLTFVVVYIIEITGTFAVI